MVLFSFWQPFPAGSFEIPNLDLLGSAVLMKGGNVSYKNIQIFPKSLIWNRSKILFFFLKNVFVFLQIKFPMPTTKNQIKIKIYQHILMKITSLVTCFDQIKIEKKFFDFFMEQFLLTKRSYCHPDLFYCNY